MSEENSLAQPEVQSPPTATGSVDPQSVEGLFLAALAKPEPDQRRTFLDQACRDEEQRRRVEALLRAYADAGSFLETPAAGRQARPGAPETIPQDDVSLDFLGPSDQPGCLGTLGPYQVIDVIGRGGMGIVLRALDAKLNRIVAVKVLVPELAANPNARRRFLREAQAAAAVSHPHVVTIHAVDEDKLPYLVMECIVGQSLQEKLDRIGALRLTEILRIGRQVAEGLAAAHQQGLIHRDIKPTNILLENGVERVKITDFGLARAADDVAITRAGEVSGTPQYMSPEQARGEHVDQRSDLFSLGSVLYAMCTGRPPFRGDGLAAVIKRLTDDTPRPIAEVNPEIPAWLSDVVQRLLEKHPDRRFQTAAELAEVLGTYLAGLHVPSRPEQVVRAASSQPAQHGSIGPSRSAVLPRLASILFLLPPVAFVWFLLAGHQNLGVDLVAAAASQNVRAGQFEDLGIPVKKAGLLGFVLGPDGLIYVGSHPAYGQLGGAMAVWDPKQNKVVENYRHLVKNQSIAALAYEPQSGLVFGGSGNYGGGGTQPTEKEALFFAFDPRKKEKVFETALAPGAQSYAALCAARGRVFVAVGSTLYVFDTATMSVARQVTLPGSQVEISLGAHRDGTLYGLCSAGVYTVNPESCEVKLIAPSSVPVSCGFALTDTGLYFGSGPHLWRYSL